MEESKACSKCKVIKPLSEFVRAPTEAKDGYSFQCKACRNAYRREKFRTDQKWREKRKADSHNRYIKLRDERRAKKAALALLPKEIPTHKICTRCGIDKPIEEFRKNKNNSDGYQYWCKVCQNEYVRDRYANNSEFRDRLNTKRDKWLAEHPDKTKEFAKKASKKYAKTHPEHVRLYAEQRRASIIGNGGSHTLQEWLDLCEKYDNRCLACGRKVKLTVDHIMPLIRGGTDDIDNIQPLCITCNSRKKTEYIDYRNPFVAMAT